LEEKVAAPVKKVENTALGIRHADHVAPSIRKKLALTSPTSSSSSVGIVRSRIQATEFSLFAFVVTYTTQKPFRQTQDFNGRKNLLSNVLRFFKIPFLSGLYKTL
jgi:hypothetical protein